MIKCSKCGSEQPDDAKFCSNCGNKINETMPPPFNEDSIPPQPPHESIRSEESERNKNTFGRIIIIIALITFIWCCITALLFDRTSAAIIAIVQIALIVVALLLNRQIIKTNLKRLYIVPLTVAMILIVPYMLFAYKTESSVKRFTWSDFTLADVVPEPKSDFGEIVVNDNTYLILNVYKTSFEDYYEYIDACAEMGFIVEAQRSEQFYSAYNEDGYELWLVYHENEKAMSINLDTFEPYETLVWPENKYKSILPLPKSTTGKITQDDQNALSVYVNETSFEEFQNYVAECTNQGFNVESTEMNGSYFATNSDGYQLSIIYWENGVMHIVLETPVYEVSLDIEYTDNDLTDPYDVNVFVDDSIEGTVCYGTTETYNLFLTKGVHKIELMNQTDDEMTSEITIEINQDEALKYKISCDDTKIDVTTINGPDSQRTEDVAKQ